MFKKFWKNNGSFIIFAIILAFAISNFYISSVTSTKNAKELIDFADSSIPKIREKIAQISNLSTAAEATPENYQKILDEIDSLSNISLELANSVPNANKDEDSRQLIQSLKTFFLNVNTEIANPLKAQVKLEKDNLADINAYSRIRDFTTIGGQITDLNTVLESAEKVWNRNQDYITTLGSNPKAEELKKSNQKNKEVIDSVKKIISQTSGELTQDQKNQISQVYNGVFPANKKFISLIQTGNIENEKFAKDVADLQQLFFKVKERYNLK